MKYCTKCGAQMDDNAVFCTACGAAAGAEAPATPAAQEAPLFASDYIAPPPPPAKKSKLGLILAICIPAAVVVLALAVVVVFALSSGNPRQKFDEGISKYAADFATIPGNEVAARMQKESFDLTADIDLSDISSLLGGADGMMGGVKVELGIKKLKTEGGIRLSASMGGMELLKFAGIMTQDKLLAGMVSSMMGESAVQAASMKLEGKPGDSLEKRIASLSTGGTDADASARVQAKLMECYTKCMDSKNYTMNDGELTDALTGKKLKTKAAVLTMDNESFIKFIDAAYAALKDDDAFFKDLETMLKSNGSQDVDAKTQVEDAIADIKEYLEDEKLNMTAKVHYSGSTPVALELDLSLTGDQGADVTMLVQKSSQKDSVGYSLELDAGPASGMDAMKADARLTVKKTAKGYDIDAAFDVVSGGETAKVTLDGTTDIEKVSSGKYNMDSEFTCAWSASGAEEASLSLELKQVVLFGSEIKSLQSDDNYLYDQLEENAKEVEKIEDLYGALFGGLMPGIS